MLPDSDIKIAGSRPSAEIRKKAEVRDETPELSKEKIKAAEELGRTVAEKYLNDAGKFSADDNAEDFEMSIQRRLLLSFAATVGFEQYCPDDALCGIAQKGFLDTVKKAAPDIYKTSGDTGAFSFYYLAYRRGGEVDRRIGQTFAMLCSHDGDPIYQELGEALYCWFLSFVKRSAAAAFGT